MAGAEDRLTGDRPVGAPQVDPVDEHRRRRRRAEAAAEAAEAAAAEAAARASAAIAAASQAAAAAEAAADAAARAAEEVEAASAAERAARSFVEDPTDNETTAVGGMARASAPPPVVPQGRSALADAETVALPVTVPDPSDAVTPAAGGRASRRRAQEAVIEVAREATRDPETQVIAPEPAGGARGGLVQRVIRSVRAQLDLRAVLTAAAVGAVLLVAGVLAFVVGGSTGPSPASPAAAAPTSAAPAPAAVAPAASAPPVAAPASAASDAPADPNSPKAVAYLTALRAAGVPTSDSGESETQAAAVICEQLAKGTGEDELVQALPSVLPTVNSKQARSMVSIAQEKYC